MMTTAAQAALRRIIEQYTKNVRFCIICNYVNKIIPAIQSRCTRFRFSPLPIVEVERRLNYVVDAEKCDLFIEILLTSLTIYVVSSSLMMAKLLCSSYQREICDVLSTYCKPVMQLMIA
jgi:DNA polymerase III delta prime subunit